MPRLRALPSRVILKFERPAEKSSGGIILSASSRMRPEFAEIEDVGDPIDEQERAVAARLEELKAHGAKIAVSVASGVGYWRDEYTQAGLSLDEWGWLKDYRAYRITELAAFIEEEAS
jgi:co-chaperonin GroES (HSP10)